MAIAPMFMPNSKARGNLREGTLYAVGGGDGRIYYGQVAPAKEIGFLHYRTTELAAAADVLTEPIMSRVGVSYPSIGRALRSGAWMVMSRHELHPDLRSPTESVQWSMTDESKVTVWRDGQPMYETTVDDPSIQHLELIAAWDAEAHIPSRLQADFDDAAAEWYIGGPIWRERRFREKFADRFKK